MKIKQLKIINQDESTEIADIGADAVNIDYNDTNVKLKLDELSNNIDTNTTNISNEMITRANAVTNLQSQVNGLASGSPLVASSVAGMTDTSRVYVNTTDGKWYYYNGNSWVAGGVYQASADPETMDIRKDYKNYTYSSAGQAVREQVKDIYEELNYYGVKNTGINLVNPQDKNVVSGYAVSYLTGQLVVNNTYTTTGFVEIKANTDYTSRGTGSKAFYDENYIFISGLDYTTGRNFTSPNNAKYMRMSVLTSIWSTFMIVEGTMDLDTYIPYNSERTLSHVILPGDKIANQSVNLEKISSYKSISSINIFNKNDEDVTNGYAVSSDTGKLTKNSSYSASGYIPIKSSTTYIMTTGTNRAFYDSNKTYISGAAYKAGSILISPSNAAYLRCSISTSGIDSYMVVEGESYPSVYVPYYKYDSLDNFYIPKENIIDTEIIPDNVLKNKKIGFLGDSYTAGTSKYHQFIAERTGIIVYNYGESASRICSLGHYVSPSDTHDVESFITRCEDMDDNLDMVLVFGGINDAGTSSQQVGTIDDEEAENSTFYAGYKLLLHKLVQKYPTAIIGCVVPPQVRNYTRLHTTFKQAILDVCNMYGVPVLDLDGKFSYSSVDVNLYQLPRYINNNQGTSDNVNIHLNTAGQRKMSVLIQKFLEEQFIE